MTQCNTVPDRPVTANTGMCRHCTYCNVQTGMGWNPVYYCELDPGRIKSVQPGEHCRAFIREPGSDDA